MSIKESPQTGALRSLRWMMWLCCAIMLAPLVLYFARGGTIGNAGGLFQALLPIALCVGGHFVLHRWLGVSCHTANQEHKDVLHVENDNRLTDEPQATSRRAN